MESIEKGSWHKCVCVLSEHTHTHRTQHDGRQCGEAGTNLSPLTGLIKKHYLNLFLAQMITSLSQCTVPLRGEKNHTRQLKTNLLISQLFTQAFLGSVLCSPVRPFTSGGSLFTECQDCQDWKIREWMRHATLISREKALLLQIRADLYRDTWTGGNIFQKREGVVLIINFWLCFINFLFSFILGRGKKRTKSLKTKN